MHHLQTRLFILFLTCLPAVCLALPSDRNEPINIEADHAQLDDEKGVTQYKGRAILTQGTLQIEGDIITFYYDENKQLSKAIAQGNLATYKQVHKQGEQPVRAKALQMEYHAKSQKIYLIGQGHVWQAGDEFSGNKIEYDIARNVVTAKSAPVTVGDEVREGGRVHIIIQPPGSKKSTSTTKPVEKPSASLTPPSQTSSTDNSQYPTGQTTTRLNIRTGPGTQYTRLGTFNADTQVIILTRQNNWLQVRGMIGDKPMIGWVNGRYILTVN